MIFLYIIAVSYLRLTLIITSGSGSKWMETLSASFTVFLSVAVNDNFFSPMRAFIVSHSFLSIMESGSLSLYSISVIGLSPLTDMQPQYTALSECKVMCPPFAGNIISSGKP